MGYWGYILLSVWLILSGLISLLNIHFSGSASLLLVLSLIAGILILVDGIKSKFTHNLGSLFLSIWLIASGLVKLTSLPVSSSILSVIAIITGTLLLLKK